MSWHTAVTVVGLAFVCVACGNTSPGQGVSAHSLRVDAPSTAEAIAFMSTATLTQIPEPSVVMVLTVENSADTAITFHHGGCGVHVRGYTATPDTLLRWRSESSLPRAGNPPIGSPCFDIAIIGRVPPHGTYSSPELVRQYPVEEILADSLPSGEYTFSISAQLSFGSSSRRTFATIETFADSALYLER